MKIYTHTENYVKIFVAALFIVEPNFKQLMCESKTHVNKPWYIHPTEYYLAIKEKTTGMHNYIDESQNIKNKRRHIKTWVFMFAL